ncbi:MAG: phytanoyl-CoA dioxygenase family protein [Deltaproteobacteria bacterium]|nr:phytanoyl-CoA dioxygenase family protein [Deltaproteobacteria bacterium]
MEVLCTTCCQEKRPTATPLPASHLYLSKRLHDVLEEGERLGKVVLILSGKFGLVRPQDLLPWYDHALLPQEVEGLVPQLTEALSRIGVSQIHFYALPATTPGWRPYHEALERACWKLGIPVQHALPFGTEPPTETATAQRLREQGFTRIRAALSSEEVRTFKECLSKESWNRHEGNTDSGGVRNLLQRSKVVAQLCRAGKLQEIANDAIGVGSRAVKATLFDKKLGANWKVPFHQDLTIAVQARHEAPGFGPWSTKEGIPHVQAPTEILDSMVALRLHLDDCPANNGALRVIPGSHRLGRLPHESISRLRQGDRETLCEASAGDVWLMKPLLFHASSRSDQPTHRRVLHVEYSAMTLPAGLRWAE